MNTKVPTCLFLISVCAFPCCWRREGRATRMDWTYRWLRFNSMNRAMRREWSRHPLC